MLKICGSAKSRALRTLWMVGELGIPYEHKDYAPRSAEILEVLGEPGHEHFRVRWEDGHESIFFPGEDAVIRHPRV